MNLKDSKGFTLIELLTVIAIIGVLISIIVVGVKASITKARNTKVLSDVSQARKIADSIWISESSGYKNLCDQTSHTLNTNDSRLKVLENDIKTSSGGGDSVCYSNQNSYCLTVLMPDNTYLVCVDDEGDNGGPYDTNPCPNADSTCP